MKSILSTGILFIMIQLISCGPKNATETDQVPATQEPQMNQLSLVEKNEGWALLFDGNTLEGWRKYKGEGVSGWEVSEGTLVGLGLGGDIGGDIMTTGQYEHFILKWEWKLGPGGNSGVIYHALEGDQYHTPWETGPEYQLIDDDNYEIELEEWQKTGADYAMYEPAAEKLVNTGDWNTSIIICNRENVEYWLNGKKLVQFVPWSKDWQHRKISGKFKDYPDYGLAKKGHIALQDHGSKVWFRNIKIREY